MFSFDQKGRGQSFLLWSAPPHSSCQRYHSLDLWASRTGYPIQARSAIEIKISFPSKELNSTWFCLLLLQQQAWPLILPFVSPLGLAQVFAASAGVASHRKAASRIWRLLLASACNKGGIYKNRTTIGSFFLPNILLPYSLVSGLARGSVIKASLALSTPTVQTLTQYDGTSFCTVCYCRLVKWYDHLWSFEARGVALNT